MRVIHTLVATDWSVVAVMIESVYVWMMLMDREGREHVQDFKVDKKAAECGLCLVGCSLSVSIQIVFLDVSVVLPTHQHFTCSPPSLCLNVLPSVIY